MSRIRPFIDTRLSINIPFEGITRKVKAEGIGISTEQGGGNDMRMSKAAYSLKAIYSIFGM
jgi:hypothetical protein